MAGGRHRLVPLDYTAASRTRSSSSRRRLAEPKACSLPGVWLTRKMASRPREVVDLDALVSVHDAVTQDTAPSRPGTASRGPTSTVPSCTALGGRAPARSASRFSVGGSARFWPPDELVGPSKEAYTSGQSTDGNGFMEEVLVVDYAHTIVESISLWGSELQDFRPLRTDLDWPNYAELVVAVQRWLSADETLTAGYLTPEDPSQAEAADLGSAAPAAVPLPVRPKRPGSPPNSKAKGKAKALLNISTADIVPQLSHRLDESGGPALPVRKPAPGAPPLFVAPAGRRLPSALAAPGLPWSEPPEAHSAAEHARSPRDLAPADGRRGRGGEAVVCGGTRPHTASCQCAPVPEQQSEGIMEEFVRALELRFGAAHAPSTI